MFFGNPLLKAIILALALFFGCDAAAQKTTDELALTGEILHMDSVLFSAFNSKNLDVLKDVFSKDLEFYHDKAGVSDYAKNMEASKTLFANVPDLNRQLVPGSTEVYPIHNYGAVQIGAHRFCHKEAGKDDCGTFRFVHIWKKTPEGWKLARVISYDH